MRAKAILLWLTLGLPYSNVYSQTVAPIAGTIKEKITGKPIAGATVSVEGTELSTQSTDEGGFVLQGLPNGNLAIVISHIGFVTQRVIVVAGSTYASGVSVLLEPSFYTGDDVIVTGVRVPQNLRRVPAFVQVINQQKLQQYAGSNVLELMLEVAGIEYTRTGVDYITINARGFNSAFNNKVLRMVDGRNSMAALSASLAMFNNGSAIKEDIERIEVVLGPQSAMYGPNALNAVVNYVTKDPRK